MITFWSKCQSRQEKEKWHMKIINQLTKRENTMTQHDQYDSNTFANINPVIKFMFIIK